MKSRIWKAGGAVVIMVLLSVGIGMEQVTEASGPGQVFTNCRSSCPPYVRIIDDHGVYICPHTNTCTDGAFGGQSCDYEPLSACSFLPYY